MQTTELTRPLGTGIGTRLVKGRGAGCSPQLGVSRDVPIRTELDRGSGSHHLARQRTVSVLEPPSTQPTRLRAVTRACRGSSRRARLRSLPTPHNVVRPK